MKASSLLFYSLVATCLQHAAHAFRQPILRARPLSHSRLTTTVVFGNNNLDKGFNILETASKVVPQGRIVSTAKEGWKFMWKVISNVNSILTFFQS